MNGKIKKMICVPAILGLSILGFTEIKAAPTCDLPVDIIAWIKERPIEQIVEAWPRQQIPSETRRAFWADQNGNATSLQQAIVANCLSG